MKSPWHLIDGVRSIRDADACTAGGEGLGGSVAESVGDHSPAGEVRQPSIPIINSEYSMHGTRVGSSTQFEEENPSVPSRRR